MIRSFGSVTGLTNQPQGLDVGLGGGSGIKSIQRGTSTLTAVATLNVPISAVDLTKAIVKITMVPSTGTAIAVDTMVKASLTTSTNLKLDRVGTTNSVTVMWEVIEFSGVKSLQTGAKSTTLTSDTVTISAVNTSKSMIFCSWTADNGDSNLANALINYTLTNGTTITFTQYGSSITKSINWQVIEFN